MSPLIAAILTSVLPAIINLVEKKRGAKAGPDKFQDVFSAAISLLQALAARGVGPNQINDNDVKAAIETIVQGMKLSGSLAETPAPATPPASVAGRTLRVKVEEVLS